MASENEDLSEMLAEAQLLASGCVAVAPDGVDGLARKIKEVRSQGRVLRVKLGFDPTSPHLHLGHAVVLSKLRRFQELGHQVVLIIGGFTAQIGDPSGRSQTRPALTAEEVAANADTYLAQVGAILDATKVEIVNNSDWLAGMTFCEVLKLASRVTANQLLAKEGFGERLRNQQPLALHELFYPVLQGFDSVSVKADVEIGGTDQLFNLLMGRQLQSHFGMSPQVALTMPLLEGTDGVRKMSKSFGNAIGLDDSPEDMFARTMRLPDNLIVKFFELATTLPAEEIEGVKRQLPPVGNGNPKDAKEKLAHRLVFQFHGEAAANLALAGWKRVHSDRLAPEQMPSHVVSAPTPLFKLLVTVGLAKSGNQARGLIESGAVRLDGEKVTDVRFEFPVPDSSGRVLSVGRREGNFVRLIPG